MNQVKHILSSLFEPLTKVETYENLVIKIIMILIYIIVALIVIAILNKVIEQAFKIQNKSKKGNKKRSKTLVSLGLGDVYKRQVLKRLSKTSLQVSLLYLRINLMLEIMLKSIAVEQL